MVLIVECNSKGTCKVFQLAGCNCILEPSLCEFVIQYNPLSVWRDAHCTKAGFLLYKFPLTCLHIYKIDVGKAAVVPLALYPVCLVVTYKHPVCHLLVWNIDAWNIKVSQLYKRLLQRGVYICSVGLFQIPCPSEQLYRLKIVIVPRPDVELWLLKVNQGGVFLKRFWRSAKEQSSAILTETD